MKTGKGQKEDWKITRNCLDQERERKTIPSITSHSVKKSIKGKQQPKIIHEGILENKT